jgi:hypothetical protein
LIIGCTLIAVACGVPAMASASPSTSGTSTSSNPYAVPAVRDQLTSNTSSSVSHDNEVMGLASQSGRLFAATDQWEYGGPSAHGQILVKNSSNGPWKVFQQTQSLRVQAIDSFSIPNDQGLGSGHSLLITQAIVGARSVIEWLFDSSSSFTVANSYALATGADVRSFGAHEAGGVWSVYAGVNPTGILEGTWSKAKHTLVFNRTPELSTAAPAGPGLQTQKVTAFADCGGAEYVTIDTKLFRRNDGALPPGAARWVLTYQEPPVGPRNSGLRGLSCVAHDGSPALLVSTEGTGDVYRLDNLPRGQLDGPGTTAPGNGVAGGLVPTLEFSPVPAIRAMLAARGTAIPATGTQSVRYVIAAYNNFETLKIGGVERQLFGLEWSFAGSCPSTWICAPDHYNAEACFAMRTAEGSSTPTYALRCLSGSSFTPKSTQTSPVRQGQAFVSIRTIMPSPFGDRRIYYGGYDCDFQPADGSAWVGSSTRRAVA